jgi:hypothetical protein
VVDGKRIARINAGEEITIIMLTTTFSRSGHVGFAVLLIAILVAAMTAVMGRPANAEVVPGYYNVNDVRVAGNASTDVDTGISLKTGDRIVVTADGKINPGCLFCPDTGPAGYPEVAPDDAWPLKGARQFSLLGKLNGQYFYIGAGKDWVNTGGPGKLYLYVNDWATADNSGAYFADIRVDRDVPLPETTITSGPSGPVSSTSATFGFSGSSVEGFVSFECSIDGGGFSPCSSPKSFTALTQGQHTFQVRAKDRFGRVDSTPAQRTWTVDTVAPDTMILSGPSGTVLDNSARFEFSSSEPGSTFECKLDGGSFEPCSSPKSYTSLASGGHAFEVRAIDGAGNVDQSPASRTWTVKQNTPPTITSLKPTPGSATRDRTPLISAVVRDAETELTQANIKLKVDGSLRSFAYDAVRDKLIRQSNKLAYGRHTVTVTVTDGQAKTTKTWSFKVVR